MIAAKVQIVIRNTSNKNCKKLTFPQKTQGRICVSPPSTEAKGLQRYATSEI